MTEQSIPGRVTLAEARKLIIDQEFMNPIFGVVKLGRVIRIRFVRVPEDTDLPDSCTMDDFRSLCSIGKARLVIDDEGDGGYKATSPVLVDS